MSSDNRIDRGRLEFVQLLRDLDECGKKLTDWEIMFVSDLIDRNVLNMTYKQRQIINKMAFKYL